MIERKISRLKGFDYTLGSWYYVTICTHNRHLLFGEVLNGKMILNDFGNIAKEELLKTKELRNNVDLDEYIIMPNHIHSIVIIESKRKNIDGHILLNEIEDRKFGMPIPGSLSTIIDSYKSTVSYRIHKLDRRIVKIWQPRFYDHIIRNEIDLYNIQKYIENIPIQWELDEQYPEN